MRAGLTGESIQELSAPSAFGQYGRITPMMEHGYDLLDAPVKRVCHPNMPVPGGYIDVYTMPTPERIEAGIRDVCR